MTVCNDFGRPLCKDCDDLADVLVLRSSNLRDAVYPFCSEHDPDPEKYGNRTTWEDKLTIRRFDEEPPGYTVYGRLGGDSYNGRVMHLELPDASGVLCEHDISSRKRYELSRALPEDANMCGKCLTTSNWWDDYSERIVGAYIYAIRKVAARTDQLSQWADRFVEYPTLSPRERHRCAEGIH